VTQHTPGPWTIEEYGDRDCPALVIHKDTETRVCFMATPGSHGDPAMIEADARLISAAPDMLEQLRTIIAEHEDWRAGMPDEWYRHPLSDQIDYAKQLVAKIEGR
jgi:hypothetical protein